LDAELRALVVAYPDSSDFQWETATTFRSWAAGLSTYEAYLPVAERAYRESTEILNKLSLSDPQRRHLWFCLANSYANLADVQWRSSRLDNAEAAFQRAMEIYDERQTQILAEMTADFAVAIAGDCLRRAYVLAITGREKEAAEFVGRIVFHAENVTDPVPSANTRYLLAVAQARLGDKAGYRTTCKSLVGLSLHGADELTRSRRIWTPCLAPDALEDPGLPVQFGKEFVANDSYPNRHFGLYILGAAHYRAGQFDQAAQRLEESIAAYPSDQARNGFDTMNYQQLLLAMAQWQLDRKDQARELLVKTLPAVEKELQAPSSLWNRRATLELLRGEAESLIGQMKADEAVEKVELNQAAPTTYGQQHPSHE
jgi:tetratricopeptide (TPR) repeat protein